MNYYKNVSALLAGALLFALAGCGGGGGGSDAPPAPSTAVIKLSTATTVPLAGTTVRLPIPYGTTVATDVNGQVQTGAIVPSGVLAGNLNGQARGTLIPSFTSYSAPTPTQKGALKFAFVAYSTAFRAGEFATVTCSFSGTAPVKSAFDTLLLQATDTIGNPAGSVGETFTLTIQ